MTTPHIGPVPSEPAEFETALLPQSVFDLPGFSLHADHYHGIRAKIARENDVPLIAVPLFEEFTGQALIERQYRETTIPSWQVLEQELSIICPGVASELSKVRPVVDGQVDCQPEHTFLECYLLFRFEHMLRCTMALSRLGPDEDKASCHRHYDNLIERKLSELVRCTYAVENLRLQPPSAGDGGVPPASSVAAPPPPSSSNAQNPAHGPPPLVGLTLSGGGIRSATFSLGVLQSIASHKRLSKFDYLSTVSGGGYLGAWLKAWIYRLSRSADPTPLTTAEASLAQRPDTTTIHRLREYSNFLSPKIGAFSPDTWTLISLAGRNLILNWLMFIPLALLVVAGPWLLLLFGARVHTWAQNDANELYRWLFMSIGTVSFLNALYHTFKFISAAQFFAKSPNPGPRGVTQTTFVLHCGIPLVLGAIFFSLAAPSHSLREMDRYILIGAMSIIIAIAAAAHPKQTQRHLWAFAGLVTGFLFAVLLVINHELLLYAKSMFAVHAWLFEGLWLTVPLALLSAAFAATVFIGITSHLVFATNLLHEWWAKFGGWILIVCCAWIAGVALTILLPMFLLSEQNTIIDYIRKSIAASGGLIGILTAVFGFFDSSAPSVPPKPSIFARLKALLLPLGAVLFAISIIAASCIALLVIMFPTLPAEELMNFDTAHLNSFFGFDDPIVRILIATSILLFILILTTRLFNYSRFSLHALYRERLVRAYLGASNTRRNPDRFTGFDPGDNIRLYELRGTLKNSQLIRPFHLLNMTLNLSSSDRLDWQERKGESFTASMLHAGTRALGYQNIQDYAGPARFNAASGKSKTGMTLGAAVAASGAAANPNMGFNSSPFVSFLLTVFNVRLGVWLPNPGPVGNGYHLDSGPKFALLPAIYDLLGMSDDKKAFVNLSDGGHFDNMGIYELVRRGVQVIVCVDGECDNVPFDSPYIHEGLSQSIRKCFIDFGVEIRSDGPPNGAPSWNNNLCPNGFWLARIHYPHNVKPPLVPPEPGYLLYIKPRLFGDLPVDLRNYHTANKDFPQQTTADQWFSESQFESYRKLGEYIADSIPQSIWNKIGLP